MEITAVEQNKEKRMKRNEDSFRDLRDNIRHTNIWILGAGVVTNAGMLSSVGREKVILHLLLQVLG